MHENVHTIVKKERFSDSRRMLADEFKKVEHFASRIARLNLEQLSSQLNINVPVPSDLTAKSMPWTSDPMLVTSPSIDGLSEYVL